MAQEAMSEAMVSCDLQGQKAAEQWMQQMVQTYLHLYVTERKRFVIMKQGGEAFVPYLGTKLARLMDTNLADHIEGTYAVAVYGSPAGSKFISFDVDNGSGETVHALVDALEILGFPRERIYVSLSGGKGYHVELLFNRVVPEKLLRMLYQEVCTGARVDRHDVEFRPSKGAAVKLPLGKHYKTGRIAWFVDQESLEPIQSHEYLLELQQVDADILDVICKDVEIHETEAQEDTRDDDVEVERNTHFYTLVLKPLEKRGTRHNTMRDIVIFQRYSGASKQECLSNMLAWISEQDQTLIGSAPEDVRKDAKQLVEWAYGTGFTLKGVKATPHRARF